MQTIQTDFSNMAIVRDRWVPIDDPVAGSRTPRRNQPDRKVTPQRMAWLARLVDGPRPRPAGVATPGYKCLEAGWTAWNAGNKTDSLTDEGRAVLKAYQAKTGRPLDVGAMRIKPTDEYFALGNVLVRAWKGTDAAGKAVVVMVCAVTPETDLPRLVPVSAPSADAWASNEARAAKRRGG